MAILNFIIQALKGTPTWVFVIFGYVLFVGIQALKTRTVPVLRLFILPLTFLLWGIYAVLTKLDHPLAIATWAGTLCLGALGSWLYFRNIPLKVDHQKQTVTLPGSSVTLILVLLTFSTKYFFGYLYATNPLAQTDWSIKLASLATSGVITGLIMGRAGAYYQKYLTTR